MIQSVESVKVDKDAVTITVVMFHGAPGDIPQRDTVGLVFRREGVPLHIQDFLKGVEDWAIHRAIDAIEQGASGPSRTTKPAMEYAERMYTSPAKTRDGGIDVRGLQEGGERGR